MGMEYFIWGQKAYSLRVILPPHKDIALMHEDRELKHGLQMLSGVAGHLSRGGLVPTLHPLAALAVDTLAQGILQAGVNSCVCHWLLVYLTARVSMREVSLEVRGNDTHIPNT